MISARALVYSYPPGLLRCFLYNLPATGGHYGAPSRYRPGPGAGVHRHRPQDPGPLRGKPPPLRGGRPRRQGPGPGGGGENLIFPAPEDEAGLERLAGAGIPNVLLVRVPEGKDPRGLGEQALGAARDYLRERAEEVLGPRRDLLFWREALAQVEDLLEGYYAYLPLEGDYPRARERLMALLAARKNTRDFAPVSWGSPAYKSSLDGARESVLRLPEKEADHLRVRLGLRPGEYLAGPDLLKRWWKAGHGFLSTTHMAALPFWEGVRRAGLEAVLKEALEELGGLVGEEARAEVRHPVLRDTPFGEWDVRLLYESRPRSFPPRRGPRASGEGAGPPEGALAEAFPQGEGSPGRLLRPPPRRRGPDGGDPGRPSVPRGPPPLLQRPGPGVRRPGQGHRGGPRGRARLLGGDDVLALLPLHTALMAARALADRFREAMAPFGREGRAPSLSVGLAVVHHLEPLQDALDLARRAEKWAKEGEPKRNALCVAYSPRSGAERLVRGRWDENPPLTRRLLRYADLLRAGEVPSRAAYELLALVREAGRPSPGRPWWPRPCGSWGGRR